MPVQPDRFDATEQAGAEVTTIDAARTKREGFKNPQTAKDVAKSRAAIKAAGYQNALRSEYGDEEEELDPDMIADMEDS